MPDSQVPQAHIIRAHTLPQARAVLSATAARWLNLTAAIPNDLLTRPPLPGEWSAAECLQHILDTERQVFPARVRAHLAGQDFPAFSPEKDGSAAGGQTAAQLAEEFARLRAESLQLLEQVTEDDLARTANHSTLGLVTLSETLNTWAAHDLNHTIQAERSLMQPFIGASGALRFRFRDHDVDLPKQG